MLYKNELSFFCDTLNKNHINTTFTSADAPMAEFFSKMLNSMASIKNAEDQTLGSFLQNPESNTLYKMSDNLGFSYIYCILPETAVNNLFLIGPFLSVQPSREKLLEVGEKNGISPKKQDSFESYCLSFPVVSVGNPIYSMIEVLCDRMWGKNHYSIVDINKDGTTPASPIIDEFDDVMLDMRNMEARYEYENEMIEAVKQGQIHKANEILSKFSVDNFEMRTSDPLRNMKNYCIIMNTLLRKAAENGGVHPIYLDSVSSGFAKKIEQFTSVGSIPDMMVEMFRSYCRLVRKHSINDYSPLVQKVIVTIDSNISSTLALSSLAAEQRVSPGYLSTIFKRETGKSVTEYIREKRVKHAAHLLATTHLQIQTVALHCGIMDVQYFSKLFKKEMGKPPKEYREEMKRI